MAIAKQRQRIENAWQQSASPFPMPKPQRRWLLITAGVIAGIALSRAQLWLTSPLTSEPQATESRCRFKVPRLEDLPDLEPRMTASEWRRLEGWVKRNPGAYPPAGPAPAPPPAEQSNC